MSFFEPAPEPATELGRLRILSSTAGIRVSPLQLGAMSIGDAWSEFMGSMDKKQSFALLDAFVEAGGNFIDTANNYQNEQSEQWLGEWMQERGNRDQMVIATKFTVSYTIPISLTIADDSNTRPTTKATLSAKAKRPTTAETTVAVFT
jgi:aryl-alcohol dehydrogenase-like predicted oxidoreductase